MSKYLYLWDKKELTPEEETIKKYLTRNQYHLFIGEEGGKARLEFDKTIDNGEYKQIEERISDPFINGIISFNDYKELASKFIEKQPIVYDKNKIWWLWNFKLNIYEIVDEIDILNKIDYSLRFTSRNTTNQSTKTEILEAIKREGRKNKPQEPPKNWVQFKNYVYDINTGEKFNPTPKYFFVNPIPHNIGLNEDTPNIDKLFNDWVGSEAQILYEIIAYCLYSDYPIHRVFCFTGTGRNGKSKYLELVRRFIGLENSTSTELDLLIENRFESSKLYKKLVCMLGETNYNTLKNTSLLKRLTGQDLINYEFKNKNPFDDYNYSKILIATNGIPITHDKSEGFYRRWIIIDFPNKFPEGKDILATIPNNEFENLALKSVKLLKRLLDTCKFTNEANIEEKAKKYEEKSNPLTKFLKEKTIKDVESYIFKYDFKEKFISWQKQNGFRTWNDIEISSIMKEHFEEKQKGQQGYRAWLGLNWVSNQAKDEKINENSQVSQVSQDSNTQLLYIENEYKHPVNLVNPVNFISWDNQAEVWHKCKVCQESPTNEYKNGLFYCKKHFEQINIHFKGVRI